jgi:hypothetical protein
MQNRQGFSAKVDEQPFSTLDQGGLHLGNRPGKAYHDA